jgi:hypothetical protein
MPGLQIIINQQDKGGLAGQNCPVSILDRALARQFYGRGIC